MCSQIYRHKPFSSGALLLARNSFYLRWDCDHLLSITIILQKPDWQYHLLWPVLYKNCQAVSWKVNCENRFRECMKIKQVFNVKYWTSKSSKILISKCCLCSIYYFSVFKKKNCWQLFLLHNIAKEKKLEKNMKLKIVILLVQLE